MAENLSWSPYSPDSRNAIEVRVFPKECYSWATWHIQGEFLPLSLLAEAIRSSNSGFVAEDLKKLNLNLNPQAQLRRAFLAAIMKYPVGEGTTTATVSTNHEL
jgi:hypothetical protein